MKGTFHNAALLKVFGVKSIILVRGIFDAMVSLMDDLRRKEKLPMFGTGINGYSFIWHDEMIKACPDDRLLDAIIDLVVPWYINFYVSWFRLGEHGTVHAKWVTYEELINEEHQIHSGRHLGLCKCKRHSGRLGCHNQTTGQDLQRGRYHAWRHTSIGRTEGSDTPSPVLLSRR
jgi:hypothetical protein